MAAWPFSDEGLRAMYPGGRADTAARRLAQVWAFVFRHGLLPRRWVTLEVTGRRSGERRRFPLGMADVGGEWYVVSMLGECNWVRNVRAAGGLVTLWHGRATACRLDEVPEAERAPILQRYLEKVPGGRPHIPVDRGAPVSAFVAVAPGYPVFRVAPVAPLAPAVASSPSIQADAGQATPRRRHRARRILLVVLLVLLGAFVAAGLSVKLQSTPPVLALPSAAASAPRGALDGAWQVARGSMAGFRVPETVAFMTGTIVGRTAAVTGSVAVAGDEVTSATFSVDLAAVTVGGKSSSQLASSLGTASDPTAVFRLLRPVGLGPGFVSGRKVSFTAAGALRLHGRTHAVRVELSGRRSGAELEVAGSLPVAFSAWGIAGPAGFGPLGSVGDHGVAEFYLVLRRG